jgi:hypothetical protein
VSRFQRAGIPASRHFEAGKLRADGPGAVLRCLVLAPGPDWVAADLESGAILRARAADVAPDVDAPLTRLGRTLSAVELTLGRDDEPADPGRPEAVPLATQPVRLRRPRRGAVRRLVGHLVTADTRRPLLGTVATSVSYADLDGTVPSVVIVAPDDRPRFGSGADGLWCQFSLGGRGHGLSFPAATSIEDLPRPDSARLLVVGFGAPCRGQLPKVVLGALPKI